MGQLTVGFVGVVRFGAVNTRVLVRAEDGLFYVMRVPGTKLSWLERAGSFPVSVDELEMATERQVVAGRGSQGFVSAGSAQATFHGVVWRGKKNTRVLVSGLGDCGYFTAVVPAGELPERGGVITVDRRRVFRARDDQVAAALGEGRLRRGPRRKGPAG